MRNEGLFTPPSLEGTIQLPGHNGGANWGSSAVDPTRGEFYVVAKNMPTLMRLVLSNEEPTAGGALGGGPASPIVTAEQKAQLMAAAKEAASKGPVRYTSPYDFMLSPSNGMTAIGPPWSEMTAYDLNTGEIKWRVPHGGVTAPPELGIKRRFGIAHAAWWSTRNGRWSRVRCNRVRSHRARVRSRLGQGGVDKDLPTGSEGVPATYRSGGPAVHRVSSGGRRRFVPRALEAQHLAVAETVPLQPLVVLKRRPVDADAADEEVRLLRLAPISPTRCRVNRGHRRARALAARTFHAPCRRKRLALTR